MGGTPAHFTSEDLWQSHACCGGYSEIPDTRRVRQVFHANADQPRSVYQPRGLGLITFCEGLGLERWGCRW